MTRARSRSPTRSTAIADHPDRRRRRDSSRFKHLIQAEDGRYPTADAARNRATQRLPRRLDGRHARRSNRAFMMGNALVVGSSNASRTSSIDEWRCRQSTERAVAS